MNTLYEIYTRIAAKKVPFFITFFVVTVVTYTILYAVDFYPEPRTDEVEVSEEVVVVADPEPVAPVITDKYPVRVTIPKTGADVTVLNPDTLDLAALDTALLDGVVRHPQTADFADQGNMLIFGHSSYLPNVFNENFQAFNGVQDLVWGDEIILHSADGTSYRYRVDAVYKVKASETIIDNSRGKAKLTIVTCNSFGSKDDRFVVEALLIATENV
jgi:LPXTG-site transpeptidase (sortase) family protein